MGGMEQALGQVISVAGSRMTARLEADKAGEDFTCIGAMIKVPSAGREVVGTISAIQVEIGPPRRGILSVDLLGELVPSPTGASRFSRGVARYPVSGAPVLAASDGDLAAIYAPPSGAGIRIGTLQQDPTQPAFLLIDDLLTKHFAVLGTTGSGKSCAAAVILSAILAGHPNAHVVLLDPHNEYAAAFGERAEVITIDNLQLPFWLFDFEEAVRVLVRGGTTQEQEAQAIILKDAMVRARRHYAGEGPATASITVDTPVPFRISDLLRFIYEAMGRLDKPDTSIPYLRLRTRLESLRDDRRFAFMFSEGFVTRDTLAQLVGRILRIPSNGIPLTIMDLSGLPSEIADVVVSLACRVVFDFVLWSEFRKVPPVLLVCEEAHRYTPADERIGFAAAARAITRIAKEGRKYGISLGLISQRPSELASGALSQCGTVFALRMDNETDQRFVATKLPDAAHGMLAALSSLRTQEAIVSGEGVPLPLRVRFDDLPAGRRPRSDGAEFSKAWQAGAGSPDGKVVEEGVRRWRLQTRSQAML
jgi:DNA helicase HerA-like ATPase